ncbi:MAG: 3-dehydroquinate synthase family protein, partial [Myxococcaceae bacterium]
FGHTFGHALESLSGFRLSHGDAVGLGMLCALDLGRALGVTPPKVALEVEEGLTRGPGLLGRAALARLVGASRTGQLASLLAADKKGPRMVLLRELGEAVVQEVPARAWREPLRAWRRGLRP